GTVMDKLDESGVADSTLLLYTSDNGDTLGEQGLIGKQTVYATSIRVPLLAYAPGTIDPGTVVNERVSNVDFAPTILDAAHQPTPDHMSGRSFLSALVGTEQPERREPFYESYWGGTPKHPTMFGTRRGQYKYIWYYGPEKNELYDVKADPLEQHNLIDESEHDDRLDAMHDRLFDWIESDGGTPIPLQRDRRNSNDRKRPPNAPKTIPDDFGSHGSG